MGEDVETDSSEPSEDPKDEATAAEAEGAPAEDESSPSTESQAELDQEEAEGRESDPEDDDGETDADIEEDDTVTYPTAVDFEENDAREGKVDNPSTGTATSREVTAEGDIGGITGPEYDEEMPLADHIEEMLKRLAIVIVIAGSVTIITFPLSDQIINFMWFSILPGTEVAQPRVYGPLEFLVTRLKVASLAGLIVALPVFVYQTYRFMRPGLYRNEQRYYLAAVPTSLVLAVIGVLFAYFIVLPGLFTYFLVYSEGAGEIAFALARTFDLMLILMAYLAIVFQIPLIIMLAIMMGITSREWLESKRLYFWAAFLGLSFISSPDPTGMAPIVITLTMVGLFEGTLTLLRWIGK